MSFPLDLHLAWYLMEWLVRIGALAIVPLRRSPAAAAGWLLLIFFAPAIGLPLYLLIGRPQFSAERRRRWRQLHPYFSEHAQRLEAAHGCDAGEASNFAYRLGRMPCVGGNTVELIGSYDELVDRLLLDIGHAQRSIDLLVYIFADDSVGKRIIAGLAEAVNRGVRCRVMFDALGSRRWRKQTLAQLREVGVETREALPVRVWRRSRADMRNHRKLFVIDDAVGYAGSQNLVAKDFRRKVINHELVARVTGPIVASMAAVIAGDWSLEGKGAPQPRDICICEATGDVQLQLLPSGADYPLAGFETLLVWQLHRARRQVILVTPYFVPDQSVIGAMKSAAARGVTVHLVVSAVVDQKIVHLAQSSYLDELLAAGVQVHQFPGGLLHAKNVTFDDSLGVLGSSNVDLRSFQLNEEVSLLLFNAPAIAQLSKIQERYIEDSVRIVLERWRSRPAVQRLLENLARIMSPLL